MKQALETLENRKLFAVTASFASGVVTVLGDSLDNTIDVSRNAAGIILINGGAVPVAGGTPTVANTTTLQVFGQGGNDSITLNEASGALPAANLFGGADNDTLTGGSGGDQIFGQAGNDVLLGKGGADFLFGGEGDDDLTAGDGDDQAFGEAGNDRIIWNPGDDTDLNEGGADSDTIEVNGGNGAETFVATANGTRVRFDRLTPAPFSLDIGTTENLVVNGNGGDDSFAATGNLAALIQLTIDGGAGNDSLLGSNGADRLVGGDGNDFIDGNQGSDVALMGAGDDVFQWDPGDGSDVVEGQDGTDTMQFNGANVNEIFELSANGSRLRFTRNIGNVVMDTNNLEHVSVAAFGGADTITANDLSGTDVSAVDINLGTGAAGDGQADSVIVKGTNAGDAIDVVGSGTSYSVAGLSALIRVSNSEGASDAVTVNALGGNDTMNASTLVAGVTRLTFDGGAGEDLLLGSRGADILIGGDGNDFVDGRQGDDLALLGANNDTFQWSPGDGNDSIEGQAGNDTMNFSGANVSENIDISANGGRVRFTRNVANVIMDLDDTETIRFNALGGADNVNVNDLTGTDVSSIELDLNPASASGGDGSADRVVINGSAADDNIVVRGEDRRARISGVFSNVTVRGLDPSLDGIQINANAGLDVIDASALQTTAAPLTINGGLGADLMIGSPGNDSLIGGDGDDVALMGAGDDTFVWNPGDDNDVIEGQGGVDTMLFNGANISENINVAANGGRVRFTRDVANIIMDLNDTEVVNFNALGGADNVTVGDLTGTDLITANIALAAAGGAGDGQADTVIVNGTNGDDVAVISGSNGGASVAGFAAQVNVTGAEPAIDRLRINMLGGNDVMDASALAANAIGLVADLGPGDDVGIGGAGNDTLDGGDGDDVLIGGPGLDVLLNGEVVIQD